MKKNVIRALEFLWQRPAISVWMVIAIAIVGIIFGFSYVEKGSVVDHPIRDIENRHIVAERMVKKSPINLSDPVFVYMRCYPHIKKEHLFALVQFQERADKFLSERGLSEEIQISSLASVVDYNDKYLGNFISREKLASPDFDSRKWAQKNIHRIDVDGAFAGEVVGEYEYFLVGFFPVQDFSELEMYRLIRAFLKQDDLTIWELYLFPDLEIHASFLKVEDRDVNMTIEPIGWSEGRGEIDIQTNAMLWINVFSGIIFLSGVLLFILLLPRQALVSLTIISIAFLFNRALIGLFDQIALWSGDQYRYLEDVFSVLNSPASLIAGFSFPLRSFYKFNLEVKNSLSFSLLREREMSDVHYWNCWRGAFSKVIFPLSLVAGIAVFDYLAFMGLQQYHGSRSMWQVAVFSATGLTLSYLLTIIFLPSMYKMIGGKKIVPYVRRFESLESAKLGRLSRVADNAIGLVSKFFLRRAASKKLVGPIAVYFVVVILTLFMLGNGLLITDSKPEELLDSVPMGHTARELRKPGRPGFSVNQVSISADLADPKILDQIWSYCSEMKNAGRTMFSPMNFFVQILQRDIPGFEPGDSIQKAITAFVRYDLGENKTLDEIEIENRNFVRDIWNDILNQKSLAGLMTHFLARGFKESTDPGQMIAIFTYEGVLASKMAQYVDLSYSKASEYGLDVLVPTKLAQYAEVDEMISQGPFGTEPPWGTLLNDLMSQASIIFIVALVFYCLNKKTSSVKIRPLVGGVLVAVPFIFSSMVVLLVMMTYKIPFDVASAAIRNITVSVAVDLPIFLILGFQRLVSQEEGGFELVMQNPKMRHEADEVLVDALVNSLAFVLLVTVSFATIHRIGLMLEVAMVSFYLATMWVVAPFMRYLVIPLEKPIVKNSSVELPRSVESGSIN